MVHLPHALQLGHITGRLPDFLRFALLTALFLLRPPHNVPFAADAGQKTESPQLRTETIMHDGLERTYHLYLPSGHSPNHPAPLVIALHGGGGDGRRFDHAVTRGTITAAAGARGVVLVFPDGIDRQWHDGRSERRKSQTAVDDMGFIAALIDEMINNYAVDPARVYATGISNGGFMSVRLAMDLSDKIAAVAPVTAQLSKALEDRVPQLPISIMVVNGTADPLVPYEGGHIRLFRFGRSRGEILSTEATIEHFRRHNACPGRPLHSALPDKDPEDGTRVQVQTYTNCNHGTEVILVKIIGGGHTWPGGKQYLRPWLIGAVSRDISASDMILDFFLRHRRVR